VHEFRVRADGNDLGAGLPESIVLLSQSSEFSRSDEGKVRGVKEEDGPLLCRLLRSETHFAEIALRGIEGFEFEVGNGLADPDAAAMF
jgi:hypothetical protein